MKKYILLILFILTNIICFGQSSFDTTKLIKNVAYGQQLQRVDVPQNLRIPKLTIPDTTSSKVSRQIGILDTNLVYSDEHGIWRNVNPDLSSFIQKQTQSPSATISGGETRELMGSGADLVYTFNWGATRAAATSTQLATANLNSITVGGFVQSFSNPSAGSTINGTQNVPIVRNVNTTVTILVTTADGKTASASSAVLFSAKRYWGFVSTSNPSNGTIQALTNEFVSTRTRSVTPVLSPTGSQYFFLAFPESLDPGNVSQIWVGGIDQTDSFTRTVVSFTNASGNVQNYIYYVTNSPTAGSIQIEIK